MKQILQNIKTGATEVVDVPLPGLGRGQVLVRTARTLVSAGDGTDAGGLRQGGLDREGPAAAGEGPAGSRQDPDGRAHAHGGGGLQQTGRAPCPWGTAMRAWFWMQGLGLQIFSPAIGL